VKPGEVLTCTACGASSAPLHSTGGRRWEDGGALVATWPDATLQRRHEVVTPPLADPLVCLPCHYRALEGLPPAAPGSGAELRELTNCSTPPAKPLPPRGQLGFFG
jgi:hypothetical protein